VVEIEIIFVIDYEVIDLNVDKYTRYSMTSYMENGKPIWDVCI